MKLRRLASVVKNTLFRKSKPSLNGLDDKLQKYLSFDGGFFIEAGANDGYSQSNTYFLEKRRGWKGLLVEGIPELAHKCIRTRKLSRIVNCALVANAHDGQTVTMHYAHLMSLVDGAMKNETEENEYIALGIKVQHLDASYEVEVPARTLESVLEEDPPERIDFFSLDVEGFELEVLKGINLDRFRPNHILVEILEETGLFDQVDSFLRSNRYLMVERMSDNDYFYRDSNCDV